MGMAAVRVDITARASELRRVSAPPYLLPVEYACTNADLGQSQYPLCGLSWMSGVLLSPLWSHRRSLISMRHSTTRAPRSG
jgi:hypothetical protein